MSFNTNRQLSYIKTGMVIGGVTVGISMLAPFISGIVPNAAKSFLFQTYNDPLSAFVNEIIMVWCALNLMDAIPTVAAFAS